MQHTIRIRIPEGVTFYDDRGPQRLLGHTDVEAEPVLNDAGKVVEYHFVCRGRPARIPASAIEAPSREEAVTPGAVKALLDSAEARFNKADQEWRYAAHNLELFAQGLEETLHGVGIKLRHAIEGKRKPRFAVNSLGELQAQGPKLDVMCANVEALAKEREEAEEEVSRLQTALRIAVRAEVNPTSPKA